MNIDVIKQELSVMTQRISMELQLIIIETRKKKKHQKDIFFTLKVDI